MIRLMTPSQIWEGVFFIFLCFGPLAVGQDIPKANADVARALSLYRSGDLRDACPMFTQSARDASTDPVPRLYLIGCAIHGRNAGAVKTARQALDGVAPSGAPAHQTAGSWLASGGYCQDAEREYSLGPSGETAAVQFSLGRCYQAVGNATAAALKYEKALQLDPNTEEYYLSLAILLMAGGKSEAAGDILLRSAERFPNSVRTLIAMSLLHLELGYPNRARIGYEKASALAPASPAVWKLLGRIQMAEGSYEEAVRSLEQAASIDRNDAQTYLLMGMAEVRIEGGADKALAYFQQAVGLDSGLTEARIQIAAIYLQNKSDLKRAAAELERVLSAEPDSIRAHRLLMQVYQRQGMTKKAAFQAEEIRRLSEAGRGSDPQNTK